MNLPIVRDLLASRGVDQVADEFRLSEVFTGVGERADHHVSAGNIATTWVQMNGIQLIRVDRGKHRFEPDRERGPLPGENNGAGIALDKLGIAIAIHRFATHDLHDGFFDAAGGVRQEHGNAVPVGRRRRPVQFIVGKLRGHVNHALDCFVQKEPDCRDLVVQGVTPVGDPEARTVLHDSRAVNGTGHRGVSGYAGSRQSVITLPVGPSKRCTRSWSKLTHTRSSESIGTSAGTLTTISELPR